MRRSRVRLALLALVAVSLAIPGSVAAAGPSVGNDALTVAEDSGTTTIDVLANDGNGDNGAPSIASATQPANGIVVIADGGLSLTYEPNANYHGLDHFTYVATDGVETAGASVDVTVTSVDDAPHANDDSDVHVSEDSPSHIDVLGNDTDIDTAHGALNVVSVDVPTSSQHGGVSIASDGSDVTYTPDPNFNGTDSFSYVASDGALTDTGTVFVVVDGTNDPPVATDDSYSIAEDSPADFDVRSNDTDPDGDSPTITDSGNPGHGTATVLNGKIHYVPDPDYNGSDSLTYTITDGALTDSALVTITVTPVNDAPVAIDHEYGMAEEGQTTAFTALSGATDPDVGDTLMIVAVTQGTKGVVTITGSGTTISYRPFHNQFGTDTFTYTVSDGDLPDTATITMDIGGLNDDPRPGNDAVSVPEGAGVTAIDVLANDTDPDDDEIVITGKTNGAHGTVAITGFGTGITYNPSGNYHGSDMFKYTVSDGHGGTDSATVLVTVVKDADDPTITAPLVRFYGQTVGTSTTKVRVSWTGADAGSGVHDYRLQVSTNDGSFKTVTLATATSTSGTVSLSTGSSYRFRVRVADNEGNSSHYAYSKTLTILRSGETSSAVAYVGTWSKSTTKNALGGTARFSSSPSKSATYSFDGTDVAWIATRATSSGKAKVFIDGVLVTTVDLDISKTKYKQLVVQRHLDVGGSHTMRIEPVGDGRVDIDGFAILR